MAQKVLVELVDDLDGTATRDIRTVEFSLEGVSYEIDLTEHNANRLRTAVAEYVASARRTGGRRKHNPSSPKQPTRSTANPEQSKAIRDWARRNGFDLADRGRIPSSVIEAFEQVQAVATKPRRQRGKTKGK